MAASVDEIFGMLNSLGKNSTVSDILSALALGVYSLFHLYCVMAGPVYHPGSPCVSQDALSLGLFSVTTNPGGTQKAYNLLDIIQGYYM